MDWERERVPSRDNTWGKGVEVGGRLTYHLGAFRVSEWMCLRLGERWGENKEGSMMEWSPTT